MFMNGRLFKEWWYCHVFVDNIIGLTKSDRSQTVDRDITSLYSTQLRNVSST